MFQAFFHRTYTHILCLKVWQRKVHHINEQKDETFEYLLTFPVKSKTIHYVDDLIFSLCSLAYYHNKVRKGRILTH